MNAVTPEGKELIQHYESLRLMPYFDPIGVKSIGYGHVILPGEFKDSDLPLTEARADALLDRDIALKATWVAHYICVPLNDNQFSALVSLVFNAGVTPLCQTLGKKLNAGDYAGASQEFSRWVYAGGKKLPGLVTRRAAEKALFDQPTEETTHG